MAEITPPKEAKSNTLILPPDIVDYREKRVLNPITNLDASIDVSYSGAMKKPIFDNSFTTLPDYLYERVTPTPIKNPHLIHATELRALLGLDALRDEELVKWLNGEKSLEGEQRIATRYAGHQFGVWAGQLGDGRAISLGEIITDRGERLEVQTKGSGRTPFSRMGDGKAVIRSSVREYLCSEAMHGLGIPTTRVLALITGEDKVYRETVEKSAVVARVFPSNLRFGHFELCFHFEKHEELDELISYARKTFFPEQSLEEMLKEVVTRTGKLIAQWMGCGFSHGVMNTDNMSLLGLTIDYGPFGFLEDTDLGFICNHSDHQGRYAFGQQPSVGMWNLERFLVCFLKKLPKEKLEEILNLYPQAFENEYKGICRQKLGLMKEEKEDHTLFSNLLRVMSTFGMDYTYLFRELSHYQLGQESSLKAVWDYYGNREELKQWLTQYDERLKREDLTDEERHHKMRGINPKYVLKNYIAQEVIAEVERGESGKLNEWLKILYSPFEEHPGFEHYAMPTPSELKHFEVSCSS